MNKKYDGNLHNFLVGEWDQVGIGIVNGYPVETESYQENISIKNESTVSIDHNCFGEWQNVEMGLSIENGQITMTQEVAAKGTQDGNTYNLKGSYEDGTEVRFKLYAMGDKYIQLREMWKDGSVYQVDFSYLDRK